jgi:hypothetical protein
MNAIQPIWEYQRSLKNEWVDQPNTIELHYFIFISALESEQMLQ